MAQQKRASRKSEDAVALLLRLQSLNDPVISSYISKMRAKYSKYALPAEEARRIVDESMGEKTLTDILNEIRD
ncbi:MAG: hypothetical protein HYX92_16960 [Chloroflexi bacterium]|nr:hypothetical protein [Chloroflexota bacterium]